MGKLQLNLNGQSLKLPTDIFKFEPTHASRYWILATLLSEIDNSGKLKVLDVGGKKGLLRFFPGFSPTVIDIEESDEPRFIQGDALNMPFDDMEFDYVVSCDVLEHIPERDRERFVLEMMRVSKDGAIICAPFDNPGVSSAEQEMNAYHKQLSHQDHRWLKEHIDNGLPKEGEIENILETHGFKFVKFRHLSLDIWRFIVKIHLLQSAFNDDTELTNLVFGIYKMYYTELCQFNYSSDGYRTFYVISKTDDITVKIPDEDDADRNKQQFIKKSLDDIFQTLSDKLQEQKQSNESITKIYKDNELEKEKISKQLDEILSSKRWRMVSRLAQVKSSLRKKDN